MTRPSSAIRLFTAAILAAVAGGSPEHPERCDPRGSLMCPESRCRAWTARFAALAVAVACLVMIQPGTALAAPPANDDFANATPVSALPFSDSGDLNGTTTEPGEPRGCSSTLEQTVWYAFTPTANTVVKADLDGSDLGVVSNVYYQLTGSGFDGLQLLGCIGFGNSFSFAASSTATYYIQVRSISAGPANLQFHLQEIPPPPNDDFANAMQITTLPFSDIVDHPIAATREPAEPRPCAGGENPNTMWWAFTPTATGSYFANNPSIGTVDVYTGSSLADLTLVACSTVYPLTFQANAGTTYYLRASGGFIIRDAPIHFGLQVTPVPTATFLFVPFDASTFDTIQFFDQSFDPGEMGIASRAWTFGDGVTADGCCPTHQYAVDGDYTVGLTVTTFDGRIGSTSQVVQVRTHDVAIVRTGIPKSAHAGQAIAINVYVRNTRYPETVQVNLFKSSPFGFEQVDTLTQSVPVKSGNRTTLFTFTNTITDADRSIGKVSFKAVATIPDHRDALPGDNELISLPVKVT